jgi:hypothetical protein
LHEPDPKESAGHSGMHSASAPCRTAQRAMIALPGWFSKFVRVVVVKLRHG